MVKSIGLLASQRIFDYSLVRLRRIGFGTCLFLISAFAFAAQPNQWHGLVLDKSSPAQAIEILGKPTQDDSGMFKAVTKKYRRQGSYTAFRIGSLPTAKELPVRLMLFDGTQGFKDVVLIFREEKLAMICLAPDKTNKIIAANIGEEYGLTVRPLFNQRDFDAMWIMWDQSSQEVRPRQYPVSYDLVGSSSDYTSVIVVGVANMPSFGKELARGLTEATTHIPVGDEKNPGTVYSLCLLSPSALAIPRAPHNSTLQ